jgi:hypothetical protein
VAPALGFCGSHTHLSARAEEGEVKINTFGYFGSIVSVFEAVLSPYTEGRGDKKKTILSSRLN